jgi:hypothetical protein
VTVSFELADVVPWGPSFDEYVAMFGLAGQDLSGRILGCGDGPASFNAVASARGHSVVSADPLYRFSAEQIQARIDEASVVVAEQARRNADQFVWTRFASVDALVDARMMAMRAFLADYPAGLSSGRYVDASLPRLPFPDRRFDLALCSHFLFLYSEHLDGAFHLESLCELIRTARDVRVFPLLELSGARSRHVSPVLDALRSAGYAADVVPVGYEFQRGGNEMLRIRH